MINSRRQAREAALQALYQTDSLSEWNKEKLELFFQNFYQLDPQKSQDNGNYLFSVFLAEGVIANQAELDTAIARASQNWTIERMSRIDRNILRISTFELMHCKDTPPSVVINEAMEIAKIFSSEESLIFLNGVLDKVSKQLGQ